MYFINLGILIEKWVPYMILMSKMASIAFVHTGYKTQNAKLYE
jgi:hypothetical protein